jgi:hypothetical protein
MVYWTCYSEADEGNLQSFVICLPQKAIAKRVTSMTVPTGINPLNFQHIDDKLIRKRTRGWARACILAISSCGSNSGETRWPTAAQIDHNCDSDAPDILLDIRFLFMKARKHLLPRAWARLPLCNLQDAINSIYFILAGHRLSRRRSANNDLDWKS